MTTTDQLDKERTKNKDASFNEFMTKEVTRLLISLIPASEHKEVLETLLKESFNTGFNSGEASIMSMVLSKMNTPPKQG